MTDSFKFDAGETNWLPSSFLLNDNIPRQDWPVAFTKAYVQTVSSFGPMIEVRVGRNTQEYPIWVRMLDKDSHWGFDNGLKTLVTTLLQMSMVKCFFESIYNLLSSIAIRWHLFTKGLAEQ